jgi:hypothetical protein
LGLGAKGAEDSAARLKRELDEDAIAEEIAKLELKRLMDEMKIKPGDGAVEAAQVDVVTLEVQVQSTIPVISPTTRRSVSPEPDLPALPSPEPYADDDDEDQVQEVLEIASAGGQHMLVAYETPEDVPPHAIDEAFDNLNAPVMGTTTPSNTPPRLVTVPAEAPPLHDRQEKHMHPSPAKMPRKPETQTERDEEEEEEEIEVASQKGVNGLRKSQAIAVDDDTDGDDEREDEDELVEEEEMPSRAASRGPPSSFKPTKVRSFLTQIIIQLISRSRTACPRARQA